MTISCYKKIISQLKLISSQIFEIEKYWALKRIADRTKFIWVLQNQISPYHSSSNNPLYSLHIWSYMLILHSIQHAFKNAFAYGKSIKTFNQFFSICQLQHLRELNCNGAYLNIFDVKRRYSFICPYISFGNLCKFSKEYVLSLSSYKLLICNMVLKFTAEILFSVGEMNLSLKIYCKILINYSVISYRMLQTIGKTKQNSLLL